MTDVFASAATRNHRGTLLLGGDPTASLRAGGGLPDGVAALGGVVREEPALVAKYYEAEIAAGVDVVSTLTADTLPRALGYIGMAFRAAAMTRCAVDLALDAKKKVDRPVAVAGILGNRWVEPIPADRVAEECSAHAARLATAGCEIIIARGFDQAASLPADAARTARVTAVESAKATRLPTWSVVEIDRSDRTADGEAIEDYARSMVAGGAELLLLEVPGVDVGLDAMKRVTTASEGIRVGVLLAAAALAESPLSAWVEGAMALVEAGAHAIGGGAGTTTGHIAALASALGGARDDRSASGPNPGRP